MLWCVSFLTVLFLSFLSSIILLIWSRVYSQFCIPYYMKELTNLIGLSFIHIFLSGRFHLIAISLVYFALTLSLNSLVLGAISFSSLCGASYLIRPFATMQTSSVNRNISTLFGSVSFAILSLSMLNKNGHIILPWGVPFSKSWQLERFQRFDLIPFN